jgi:hypothetical protein
MDGPIAECRARSLSITAVVCLLLHTGIPPGTRADDKPAPAQDVLSPSSSVPAIGEGELISLSAFPAEIHFQGQGELQQLVLTGHYANGGVCDLTPRAQYRTADDSVVGVSQGSRLESVGNGSTDVLIEFDGKSLTIPVTVTEADQPRRINFTNDIVPIFSKLGCNTGACHGKSSGQNGFRLSLLGFEPEVDFEALAREGRGRRVFPAAADRSLLLLKPTGTVPHGGGVRLLPDSRDYRLIARWISSGMPMGESTDPKVVGIHVAPHHRLIGRQSHQQITVTAHYNDGTTRDVTADAEYHSNDAELLEINASGLVKTSHLPGEGSAMARYLGHVAVFRATIPLDTAVKSTKQTAAPAVRVPVIDEFIFAKLDQLGIPPAELCTDGQFIRRASIDICGTLPTADEVKAFLADEDPKKREKLVEQLLHRPEYASYFALKWGDILRNRQRGLVNVGGGAGRTRGFHQWIHQSLAENKPYDEFVREILTARGAMYGSDSHPAVGWYNVLKTPQVMVDDTAQIFLGTRIQCAQCHHHPYEKWSQDDYWGMAGFFARVKLEKPKDKPPKEFNNAEAVTILDEATLADPQGKTYAMPRPLGGEDLVIEKGDDPREALADWMTAAENPFFARAVVNRYWSHFFGSGITDEPDDMRVTNPPSHPELLDALAKEFADSGFDLKHLIRAITTSTTYQLSSTPNELNQKAGRSFARSQPRRLPAEVLLDAIDQVTGSPTPYGGNDPPARAIELPDETVPLRGGYRGNFLEVFGKPSRDSACECERVTAASLTQSLYMIGSEEIHRKLKDRNSRSARLAADERPLAEKIDELFLSAFSRLPTADDSQAAAAFLAEELALVEKESSSTQQQVMTQQAYEDLIWALINTKEFMFNH